MSRQFRNRDIEMKNRAWTMKLMATDEHPEATVRVSQEDAVKLLRGLMHGPGSPEYAYVEAVTHQTHAPEPVAA
jgi:hypothetical protein